VIEIATRVAAVKLPQALEPQIVFTAAGSSVRLGVTHELHHLSYAKKLHVGTTCALPLCLEAAGSLQFNQ
jgi:hypothetical protein